MKTKTINCYLFEELSEEQQQKVIDKNRDINIDESIRLDDLDDIYVIDIEAIGFIHPEIYYDLSYCQGSGACFETDEFDFSLLLKDFRCRHKEWLIAIINRYCETRIRKHSLGYHYMHSRTRDFEIGVKYIDYSTHRRLIKQLGKIEAYIEQLRLDACDHLYSQLQTAYEDLISDESVKETLIANEYYFNEDTLEIESV